MIIKNELERGNGRKTNASCLWHSELKKKGVDNMQISSKARFKENNVT